MAVPPTPPKNELRRTMRQARAAYVAGLGANRARLEAALADVLAAHLGPGNVAAYRALGGEIDVGLDRVLAFPRVTDGALVFHRCGIADCAPGFAGIAEPPATAPVVAPDIILVPLVAVDARGNRLGQGAGQYDRTLAALRARRKVLAVGVAWDVQLVDALPVDPWDAPLDALATPSGWRDFAGR